MNPTFTIDTVTPAIATRWLGLNTNNRHPRITDVRALAADMRGGRWQQNSETIKFGTDGRLIDGQHRLMAIELSGVVVGVIDHPLGCGGKIRQYEPIGADGVAS